MEDVQGRPDDRAIALDKVGVSDLALPIVVLDRENERQHTVARLSLSVNLPHDFKGTHMSRFIEVLEGHRGELTMRTLPALCQDLRVRLDADTSHVEARFPYFLKKRAPVSGAEGLMDVECTFIGEASSSGSRFILGVRVPVTSLCPCSKTISDYGAHNQRGYITVEIRPTAEADGSLAMVWIEEVVELCERSASAPVYPLLKRADERHVTMQAYDNPVFVEDMVRNVAQVLRGDARVAWFRVHARNEESIHNHAAFAEVSFTREAVA